MDEEKLYKIKQVATGVMLVVGYTAIAYGSYKLFAGMVAGSVTKELLKKGIVLATVAAV